MIIKQKDIICKIDHQLFDSLVVINGTDHNMALAVFVIITAYFPHVHFLCLYQSLFLYTPVTPGQVSTTSLLSSLKKARA